MIATKPVEIRNRQKAYFDQAFLGETIIVSRPKNQNVVIIGEREYNAMLKAIRNAEYLEHLDRSYEQLKRGDVIVKSLDELEAMENE